MSGLNRDYFAKGNAKYYPVWFNMSQAEKDDRAKFVAARDWAGLLLKYPATEANWGGWTIPKSSYEFAGFNADGAKVYGENFKNRAIPLSLFSYVYENGKRVYKPFTPAEIAVWFTQWAKPVPGDDPDPKVLESQLKNVLAAQASVQKAYPPGDVELNVPRFGPTFSTSEYLTVKTPKFGQTLLKVAAVVAGSVVGGAILGPAVGSIMGKAGAALGLSPAAAGAVSAVPTASRAATVVKAVNNASKVYNVVQKARGVVTDSKKINKAINQIHASPTFIRSEDLPNYSPVPAKITDPSYRDLTIAETMKSLAPTLKNSSPAEIAAIQGNVATEVDRLISAGVSAGADQITASPSGGLTAEAVKAQADAAKAGISGKQIGIALAVVAALVALR